MNLPRQLIPTRWFRAYVRLAAPKIGKGWDRLSDTIMWLYRPNAEAREKLNTQMYKVATDFSIPIEDIHNRVDVVIVTDSLFGGLTTDCPRCNL